MHLFALVALFGLSAAILEPSYFAEHNDSCIVSGHPPSQPLGSDFCTQFASKSCCLPSFDVNHVQEAFLAVIPQGPGCGATKHSVRAAYSALRRFACLPCDPMEPQYRFLSSQGDIAHGGVVPAATDVDDTTFTWRICRSFFYGRQSGQLRRGLWGTNASHFDKCGVNIGQCKALPVFNVSNRTFSVPDPDCTSTDTDLVIPSVAFADFDDPAAEMLSYLPQTIGGFRFVVVDDEDPSFDFRATPCFGSDVNSAAAAARALVSLMLSVCLVTLLL